jgi:hypothetical protein
VLEFLSIIVAFLLPTGVLLYATLGRLEVDRMRGGCKKAP